MKRSNRAAERSAEFVVGREGSGLHRRPEDNSNPLRGVPTSGAERVRAAWPASLVRPLIGECVADVHPALYGRVQVRVARPPQSGVGTVVQPFLRWLPVLQGVSVRRGDRVLLQVPENWLEPVVVGVLDGFCPRTKRATVPAASLELRPDEVLEVRGALGRPLVQVRESEGGPVIRLLDSDASVELDGSFSLRAKRVRISAEDDLSIEADGATRLSGRTIDLN